MPLPDFIIIGAAKCGTTAASHNLSHHPEIVVGADFQDEFHGTEWVRFFMYDDVYARGLEWYAAQFNPGRSCPRCGRCQPKRIIGDRATRYFRMPKVHTRIKEAIPNIKLIVLLRNPVTRSYSHWNHFYHTPKSSGAHAHRWGHNSFEVTIGKEPNPEGLVGYEDIVDQGHYAQHLLKLFETFPREQVYIGISERVRGNMAFEYGRMFSFLGADPLAINGQYYKEDLVASNHWPYPGPMKPETKLWLMEHYRSHNEQLFQLLGGEITEWMVP